jgi:S1-C subfamily serine protease
MTITEEGPRMTDRQRFYFAAVLAFLMLVALATTCGACRAEAPVRPPVAEPHLRSPAQQVRWTVEIDATCGVPPAGLAPESPVAYGSGVVVTRRSVLTAHHVIKQQGCTYEAVEQDGTRHLLVVDVDDAAHDTTRLTAIVPFPDDVPEVDVGQAPALGDLVCAVGRVPWTTRFCGWVQPPQRELGADADIVHQVTTQPGNSGGPLYDSSGRLVGITTRYVRCISGQYCGGAASSLQLRAWIATDQPPRVIP